MSEFGSLIRTTREQRGETGTQVAQRLGVAHSTLVRMERGQMSNPPDPDLFWKLSETIGLPPEDMLSALGYLKPGSDRPAENEVVSAVRAIVGNRGFTEAQVGYIASMVRAMVDAMESGNGRAGE